MSGDYDTSPLDVEPVDAEPMDAPDVDDMVDAEALGDDVQLDPDVIVVDVNVEPGTEVDIRNPSVPPLDPNAIIDAELDVDQPIPDSRQRDNDGARPSGGSGGRGGGFSGKTKRRRFGGGGGGGGSGLHLSLLGGLHLFSGNRANVGTGNALLKASATGNTGIGTPRSTGRRPLSTKKRPIF